MNKLQKARAKLQIKHVFFATLVLSLPMEADESIPTAATDMTKIIYNPKFFEGLTVEQIMFVLVHEVMHVMFKHGLRKRGRNHRLWNAAGDFAINLIAQEAGFEMIPGVLLDRKFAGMSAEQIYDKLLQDQNSGGGGGGKGEPQPGDVDYGNPFNGDVMEPEHMDAEARAKIERTVQQHVAQAASMARMAGKLGGSLERLVNGIINPPLPWQDLLREYMTRVTKHDESWTRRNRRIVDAFLPARHSEQMGEVVVIGDTSGSMDNGKHYAQVGAELTAICDQVKPERVRVIWADDTDCALEEIFEPGDPIVLHPKGGGGTDMCRPLRHVVQFDPEVVILITDGYTPWPDREPDYPLIVCCTTDAKCPVGSVIRMRS